MIVLRLNEYRCSAHVAWAVEKPLRLLKKNNCMRQFCVCFTDGAKAVNFQTLRFLAGRNNYLSHRLTESVFASFAGVEATSSLQP